MMPETKAFRANKANLAVSVAVSLIIAFMAVQARASDSAALMEKQLFDLNLQVIAFSEEDTCALLLFWLDVEALLIANGLPPQPVAIYRSELSYPGDDGSGGELVYSGTTSQNFWIDENVVLGVDYYYTLAIGVHGTIYFISDTVSGSCSGTDLNLRATPARDKDDKCYISLTWLSVGEPVTIYRSVYDYPLQNDVSDGMIVHYGTAEESTWLDENVFSGERYFYTVVAGDNVLAPEAFAISTAVACDEPMPVYTELFDAANPFDLNYSQVEFRPVQADPPSLSDDLSDMTYADYEVTRLADVTALPVAKSDADGFALDLPLTNDVLLPLFLTNEETSFLFPFFGKRYATIRLSANGYIALGGSAESDSFNEAMMDEEHFSEPRIAFFNTALQPEYGGKIWARLFEEKIVFTFEEVPVKPRGSAINPDKVTAQVELFFSGHIRMTWLEGAMNSGVVGISDGRGIPQEPGALYPSMGLSGAYDWMPFLSLPNNPQRISLEPIAWPMVDPLETITIEANVEMPLFLSGTPELHALWTGPGEAPFTDMGNGSGFFQWTPGWADSGLYLLRIVAIHGEERVFQDLILDVRAADPQILLPRAVDLEIESYTSGADPREDHAALAGEPLFGSYTYVHPLAENNLEAFSEGETLILWFNKGLISTAYTNRLSIPSNVTQPGDEWYFLVYPKSASGISGPAVSSATVSIVSIPVITSVEPAQGSTSGGTRVAIRGQYLNYPQKITFGGIAATEIVFINSGHIEVTSPPHAEGRVAIVVETLAGATSKSNAFRYVGSGEVIPDEKQNAVFGCGSVEGGSGSGLLADLFPALALLALLAFRSRKTAAKVS